MDIIPFSEKNKEEWDSFCLKSDDAWFWHIVNYMDYTLNYRPAASPINKSFLIKNGKEILAICPLIKETINNINILSYGGGGYTPNPCFKNEDSDNFRKKLLTICMKEIDRVAVEEDCKEARIEITPLNSKRLGLSDAPLNYNYLMDFGYLSTSTVTQIIKIKTFEEIKSGARKTYRHVLQNFKDKVRLNTYDSNKITWPVFLRYKELHHKDAGRKTRPDITFRLMYEAIKMGHGFLSEVTDLRDNALGYSLFYIYKRRALYMSACTEPNTDLPIGHLVQWNALKYLSDIKAEYYDTSNQFPSFQLLQDFDVKKRQISFFKRGFGGILHQVFRGIKFYDRHHLKEALIRQLDNDND